MGDSSRATKPGGVWALKVLQAPSRTARGSNRSAELDMGSPEVEEAAETELVQPGERKLERILGHQLVGPGGEGDGDGAELGAILQVAEPPLQPLDLAADPLELALD